jgi:hypothetical protein
MAHNLTEASTFTADVNVPDDGDDLVDVSVEPAFQSLANRTKYLKARVDALEAAGVFGRYAVSGTPASGAKFALTQIAANGLTLASDEVTITQDGLYLLTLSTDMQRNIADDGVGTADGAYVVADIYADAVSVGSARARRFNDEVGISVHVVTSVVLALSVGQKVSVKAAVADLVAPATADESRLLCVGRIA